MQLTSNDRSDAEVRCGIVLAAGDGKRLRDSVYQLRGDYLPKQYVNLFGSRSMLEHTFARADKLIAAQRLFTVVAREHLDFSEVRSQLARRPRQTLITQPCNRDTAAGILLPLMAIHKQYPDAVAAIFPSDHFILEEDRFMSYVERGFGLVHRDSAKIVLLGIEPEFPDSELGYIVPGQEIEDPACDGARKVALFVEKPRSQAVAAGIIKAGALWNTFVMVAKVKTLLDLYQRSTPELFRAFAPLATAIGTPAETRVTENCYQGLAEVNFSKDILEALPFELRQSLAVVRVRGVTWNDWGTRARWLRTLEKMGVANPLQPEPWSAQARQSPGQVTASISGPAKTIF